MSLNKMVSKVFSNENVMTRGFLMTVTTHIQTHTQYIVYTITTPGSSAQMFLNFLNGWIVYYSAVSLQRCVSTQPFHVFSREANLQNEHS